LIFVHKNFKRVVVDTFVYHKFYKFHGVLAWVLQIGRQRLMLEGKPKRTLMSPRGGWIGLQKFQLKQKLELRAALPPLEGGTAFQRPWVQHSPNLVEMY
jgi:hypothetical protein